MKKLLALVLILGMASVASAGLVYKADGVEITPGADVMGGAVLSMEFDVPTVSYTIKIDSAGDATLDDTNLTFASGFLFGNGVVGTPTDIWVRMSGDNFLSPVDIVGVWTGLIINGKDGSAVITNLSDQSTLSFNVIPEPMTMSLLGLGGLGLLRRRRA